MHSPWMRLFALAFLLAAPACLVDPVDFTGKSCAADSDCADGYRCSAGKCVSSGSAAPDASPGPVDAALPGDASLGRDGAVEPGDAEVVEPPDAEVVEPADGAVEPADAGKKADGSVSTGDAGPAADAAVVTPPDATVLAPDGGVVTPPDGSVVQPPDAAVTPPDAGGGCQQDSDCKTLGAFYCSGGACLPCNTNQKCGASCSTCGAGTSCDGTACAPCTTDLKCGLACAPCAAGASCDGTSCQPCTTDAKCGPACSTCGAGTYCAVVGPGGGYSCTACNVPAHCGPTCSACSSPLPACGASGCAECTATTPCATTGLYCLNERCVQCRDDGDCPPLGGGVGRWCDRSTNTCLECKDNQHCGDSCFACAPPTPVCDGSQCVSCVLDADCTDFGTGTYCCNRQCIVPEVPKLAGFMPLNASKGSTVTMTLYGTGFNECSEVLVDGVPATPQWLGSATKLDATIRVPFAGSLPVVVHNPGLGGGDSSPNSWSLGADLPTPSSSTGIAYVPGADLVALASDSSAVEVFDPAGFIPVTGIPLGNRPFGIAAGFKSLVVSLRDKNSVLLFPGFPDATYTQIFVSNSAAWVDVDPATAMGIVVGTSPDEVQFLDLTAEVITRTTTISSPSPDLFGVAFDGRYPDTAFVAYNNRAGFVQPSGSLNQVASSGSPFAISADRLNHEVFHARLTGNTVYAYPFPGASAAGSFAVGTPGNSAIVPHAFGARVLIAALDSGTGALQFVDWGAKSSLGTVGTARDRMCAGTGGTRGQPDAIAVDPTRNRAFVANSCNKVLEGYNLNILFVK